MTVTAELLGQWTDAWSTPHEGWDFSDVASGTGESATPWDVDAQCVAAIEHASAVPVARAALEPRGITVVEHDADRGLPLPLVAGSLDLVTNRHEAVRS